MNPSAIASAQLLVSNRLIEPLSEWALIDWSQRTAFPELLGLRLTKTGKDRLYRTGDQLLEHRKVIESRLREQQLEIFQLKRSVILYDATNTHFEGVCAGNPKAKHSKNKQKRNDCPQGSGDGMTQGYQKTSAHSAQRSKSKSPRQAAEYQKSVSFNLLAPRGGVSTQLE